MPAPPKPYGVFDVLLIGNVFVQKALFALRRKFEFSACKKIENFVMTNCNFFFVILFRTWISEIFSVTDHFAIKMSYVCLFLREVSGRICEWKRLLRNVYGVFFMQNLFLLHQQLVIVSVARIRLLWILEVLIQLRIRRHRSRFHPYWIFPRPAESWFEIHLH